MPGCPIAPTPARVDARPDLGMRRPGPDWQLELRMDERRGGATIGPAPSTSRQARGRASQTRDGGTAMRAGDRLKDDGIRADSPADT